MVGTCIAVAQTSSQQPDTQSQHRHTTTNLQTTGTQEIKKLSLGIPVEREIAGGRVDSYQLEIKAAQYALVEVEQRGIDLMIVITGANGEQITAAENGAGTDVVEQCVLIADKSESYKLQIQGQGQGNTKGSYVVKLTEMREVRRPQDKDRITAQNAFTEGVLLQRNDDAKSFEQAILKYNEALVLWRALKDRQKEASTIEKIGQIYVLKRESRKALEFLNQALTLYRAVEDRRGEASSLNYIGRFYDNISESQKALDYYNQALLLRRAIGDRIGEAKTLSNIGIVYYRLGKTQKALDYYNQALQMLHALGDLNGEAIMLSNIGNLYDRLGEMQKALDYYNQVLSLFRTLKNTRAVANTLNNIGLVYDKISYPQKALDHYNQALLIFRAIDDHIGEANAINNIGNIYRGLGEFQRALDFYNQALTLRRASGDRRGEATTLSNIGFIYNGLGEFQRALDFYNQALSLQRDVTDRAGEAYSLNNIGIVYRKLGELQKALDYYNQALLLFRAVGDRYWESVALNNIGDVYEGLVESQRALDYYNQALLLRRAVGDRRGEAITLNNIGMVYRSLGNLQKALENINQALELSRAVKAKFYEIGILRDMAETRRDIGDLNTAHSNIMASIELIENIRFGVLSKDMRASYLDSIYGYYELAIDISMQLHKQEPNKNFDSNAFQISERARARTLLELLTESRTDIRQGIDTQLIERERLLQQQLSTKAEEQSRILGDKHSDEQAAAIAKEIERLLTEIDQVRAQIRQQSPRYAALTQPAPIKLSELQGLLDSDTMLLEYALGEKNSHLWAITNNSITSYQLPPRKQIEEAAQRFYQLMTVRNRTDLPVQERIKQIRDAEIRHAGAATELSKILLGPVSSLNDKKRLVIVSDGSLQYIPFAALTSPIQTASAKGQRGKQDNTSEITPLLSTHEIINLPSASTLPLLRSGSETRTPSAKKLAVIADPVFTADDSRVRSIKKEKVKEAATATADVSMQNTALIRSIKESRLMGDADLPRLRFTRGLADTISNIIPQQQSLKLLDFAANRETALSKELGEYQTIIFASHGLLNSTHPELSGIVLSLIDEAGKPQNGFLRLSDVYNMKLNAELVVLGACETGLGKQMKGEGLIGLTRGFMYAGAPRVLASLWQVDEDATVELLKRFYIEMERNGKRPAEALRKAQLSMRQEKRWESAYYWAGFILQGEWK